MFQSLDAENYVAHYTPAAPNIKKAEYPGFRRRRQILTAETLSDAIRGCDTYIGTKLFSNSVTGL